MSAHTLNDFNEKGTKGTKRREKQSKESRSHTNVISLAGTPLCPGEKSLRLHTFSLLHSMNA